MNRSPDFQCEHASNAGLVKLTRSRSATRPQGALLERCLRGLAASVARFGIDCNPTILKLNSPPSDPAPASRDHTHSPDFAQASFPTESVPTDCQGVPEISERGREFLLGLHEILEAVLPDHDSFAECECVSADSLYSHSR